MESVWHRAKDRAVAGQGSKRPPIGGSPRHTRGNRSLSQGRHCRSRYCSRCLCGISRRFAARARHLEFTSGFGDAGRRLAGYLLLIANGSMDTALLFAGILALTVPGVVFFALIGLVERLALPPHAVEGASFARESMRSTLASNLFSR